MYRSILISLFCLCFSATSAFAADTAEYPGASAEGSGRYGMAAPKLSIGITPQMYITPYKNYDTQWTPYPLINYEGDWAYVRGFSAGIKLINKPYFELSVYGEYDDTAFESSNSKDGRVNKLKDRYASANAGLEARVLTPVGLVFARASRDVLGHSDGFIGDVGYVISHAFGPLEVTPMAGVRWSTSRYNDYYYGVNDTESKRSGLRSYDAGASVTPYVSLALDYAITDHWGVFCSGEVAFQGKAVKDSPMVSKGQSVTVMPGVYYSF